VDVESSFLHIQNILSDNRVSFTTVNLGKYKVNNFFIYLN